MLLRKLDHSKGEIGILGVKVLFAILSRKQVTSF